MQVAARQNKSWMALPALSWSALRSLYGFT